MAANAVIQDYTLLDNPVLISQTVTGKVTSFDVEDRSKIYKLWHTNDKIKM